MAEASIRPLQLRKLVDRVEEKRKIFDKVNEISINKGEGLRSPTIRISKEWYLDLARMVEELPAHNQRVTLTDMDYVEYFQYLYNSTVVLEHYIEENSEEE